MSRHRRPRSVSDGPEWKTEENDLLTVVRVFERWKSILLTVISGRGTLASSGTMTVKRRVNRGALSFSSSIVTCNQMFAPIEQITVPLQALFPPMVAPRRRARLP